MSTIINGSTNALTFPDTTVQNTAFTTGAVTQSTIATGVAGTGPAFSAYSANTQSLTSGTFTKVQLNTEQFDTAGAFNATGSTVGTAPAYSFNPQIAGYYQINARVTGLGNTWTRGLLSIFKNGGEAFRGSDISTPANSSTLVLTSSIIFYMNGTTDYLELYAYCSGSNLTLYTSSSAVESCMMNGTLVRAA